MEDRICLDTETEIPLSLIDPAPWNPKTPVHGVYRKGLSSSIDYFGLRDRLKVWPNPDKKGRFILLDGHQRIDLIEDMLLNNQLRLQFSVPDGAPESTIDLIRENPENSKKVEKIRKELHKYPIPCQIISQLDDQTSLSKTDAKLFTLTYNRNHARYDEVKLADEYRSVIADKQATIADESKRLLENRLKAMVRPELPKIQPLQASGGVVSDQPSFEFAKPGEFKPTADEPWGPTPPDRPSSTSNSSTSQPAQYVPLVFSLSPDGYKKITNSILRSKSRIFREQVLTKSLENLESLLSSDASKLDSSIDSIIVETALLLINHRIEAASLEEPDEDLETEED